MIGKVGQTLRFQKPNSVGPTLPEVMIDHFDDMADLFVVTELS